MASTDFRLDLGASWLGLLSTIAGRFRDRRTDTIETPGELARFLETVGQSPRARPSADDLIAAQALREGLYELARARVDGSTVPRNAVRTINAALAYDVAPTLSSAGGRLAATRPADTRQALARIARLALEQVAGANPVRLRARVVAAGA